MKSIQSNPFIINDKLLCEQNKEKKPLVCKPNQAVRLATHQMHAQMQQENRFNIDKGKERGSSSPQKQQLQLLGQRTLHLKEQGRLNIPLKVKKVADSFTENKENNQNLCNRNSTVSSPKRKEGGHNSAPTILAQAESSEEDSFALIKETYQIDGVDYGSELITRENTVDNHIQLLQQTIQYIHSEMLPSSLVKYVDDMLVQQIQQKTRGMAQCQLRGRKHQLAREIYGLEQARKDPDTVKQLSEERKQKLTQQLASIESELKWTLQYKQTEMDWFPSNYFRELINSCASYEEAVEKYIAAPINMRYQELRVNQEQKVGFYRLGVISDMRNGWISLSELKRCKDRHFIRTKIAEIIKLIEKEGILTPKQQQAVDKAVGELQELEKNPKLLDQIIANRRQILQKQMMHLLIGQVKQHQATIQTALQATTKKEHKAFSMIHLALLNEEKIELDETGWMHNERVEMEDMKEIFKEFQGKKLVFDGKGPYFDEERGEVHLPFQFDRCFENALTLNTYLLNISVQGNTLNTGYQIDFNRFDFNNLMRDHKDLYTKDPLAYQALTQVMESKKSTYELAINVLGVLLKKRELAVSVGCLSAKDRTGLVAALTIQDALEFPNPADNPFRDKVLEPGSPASRVVCDNTPHFPALKVDLRAKLPINKKQQLKHAVHLARATVLPRQQ